MFTGKQVIGIIAGTFLAAAAGSYFSVRSAALPKVEAAQSQHQKQLDEIVDGVEQPKPAVVEAPKP